MLSGKFLCEADFSSLFFHDEAGNGWCVSKATLPLVTQGENIFVFTQSFDLKGRHEAADLYGLGFEIWVQFLS